MHRKFMPQSWQQKSKSTSETPPYTLKTHFWNLPSPPYPFQKHSKVRECTWTAKCLRGGPQGTRDHKRCKVSQTRLVPQHLVTPNQNSCCTMLEPRWWYLSFCFVLFCYLWILFSFSFPLIFSNFFGLHVTLSKLQNISLLSCHCCLYSIKSSMVESMILWTVTWCWIQLFVCGGWQNIPQPCL